MTIFNLLLQYLFPSCIRSGDLYKYDKVNINSSNNSILGELTHLDNTTL